MSVRRSQTTFTAIRTEGGLLPPDLLDRVQKLDSSLEGLTPDDYRLPAGTRINSDISEAWQAVQTHWASFRRTMELVRRDGGTGTTETRSWVQQVLRELGFGELRYVPSAETIDGRSFLISHRAGEVENAPPLQIVSFQQQLDEQTSRTGGGEQRSPQALMQGYLNASDHLWGMVTNGLVFRLQRENRQIDRTLRVDFDLEGILESESFAEFRLFWLVLHRSRLVQPGERRESAWLERWTQTAASEGTRALTGLRDGVERAIEALGQGLLSHPDNVRLREQLESGELDIDTYYSELLRLVYRLLFLLVAEERALLFKTGTDPNAIERYLKHYSVSRLREEAGRARHREAHYDDLWRGLLVSFDAMRDPEAAHTLGLEPLGGGLFGDDSCPHVAGGPVGALDGRPMLANANLLDTVQALIEMTRDGITRRINYRDLDVEELGSVYEGLLEHRPALEAQPNGTYRFGFSESTSRKETGSYFTPRSLVQELLNSALDPVIDAALNRASTSEAKERALLALKVCDLACGSGHILLGAARRIGRRLAEVRAGTDREPEPADLRHATAEVIRHCLYGVDKNPLAIDLCKVALWIESHEPGRPIGFLDHHIKRGDSLIGVFDLNVLETGIPDDAYTPVTGDDRSVASDLKKRNRAERSKLTVQGDGRVLPMHNVSLFAEGEREEILQSLANRLRDIDGMPEGTVADVQAKSDAYAQLQARDDWQTLSAACDLWTWAFFAPLTKEDRHLVPTSGTVRQMVEQGTAPAGIAERAQEAAAQIGYFHWRLAFPDVFGWEEHSGGFHAVVGNAPWEQVQLDPGEFFFTRRPEIAKAPNMAARDRLIKKLSESEYEADIRILSEFQSARHLMDGVQKFIHESGRFPLTSVGRINTAPLFAEHARSIVASMARRE
jgi:hypothetical protein